MKIGWVYLKKIGITILMLIIAVLCVFGYARYIEPNRLVVKSYEVEVKKPIKDIKVVFFTDTHFGELYEQDKMENITNKINALEPDVVIFGGDLFDNYARDKDILSLQTLQEGFANIEASIGKYAVWGNHDYGGGATRVYEDFMDFGGFEILNDESAVLSEYGIEFHGYDDYLMKGVQSDQAQAHSDLFRILISHEPILASITNNDEESFMFAGHTHGGQVQIPFLTEDLLPEGSDGFRRGLYDSQEVGNESSLQLFVSSGIGVTRYPFRFLNTPEIIEIDFKHNEKAQSN